MEGLQRYGLTVPSRLRSGRAAPEAPDREAKDEPLDPYELPDLEDLRVGTSHKGPPEPVMADDPDDLFAVTDQEVDDFLEEIATPPDSEGDLPDDLDTDWTDLVEGLTSDGPEDPPAVQREGLPRPDLTPKPDFWAHLISEHDRPASLQGMLDALEDPWGVSRAVTGVRAEIHKVMRDPLTYFGPDGHELWTVRVKGGGLGRDGTLIQALTDRVEGRMRIRMLSASRSAAHRPLLEEAMRVLVERMTSLEFGAVEALVPKGVNISPDLLRAGGFQHAADLPRWSWGEDCALWVLPPRHL